MRMQYDNNTINILHKLEHLFGGNIILTYCARCHLLHALESYFLFFLLVFALHKVAVST